MLGEGDFPAALSSFKAATVGEQDHRRGDQGEGRGDQQHNCWPHFGILGPRGSSSPGLVLGHRVFDNHVDHKGKHGEGEQRRHGLGEEFDDASISLQLFQLAVLQATKIGRRFGWVQGLVSGYVGIRIG